MTDHKIATAEKYNSVPHFQGPALSVPCNGQNIHKLCQYDVAGKYHDRQGKVSTTKDMFNKLDGVKFR